MNPVKFMADIMLPAAGLPSAMPPSSTRTLPVGKGAAATARTTRWAIHSVLVASSPPSLPLPHSLSELAPTSVMSYHSSTLMHWRNVRPLSPPHVLL
jgi:hypothetical protein